MSRNSSEISSSSRKGCLVCCFNDGLRRKYFFHILLFCAILIFVTACSGKEKGENSRTESRRDTTISEQQTENSSVSNTDSEMDSETLEADSKTDSEMNSETLEADSETDSKMDSKINETDSTSEVQQNIDKEEKEAMMNIQIGEHLLTATLVQNSSTEALLEMLSKGPVTIHMNDYANMEKVGSFPESLPRNDEQISTDAGDLILYQGNSFVIYYDTNSWNFTRLGRINDVSKKELKEILGSGSVTAVLSLAAE